jgi:hypothetical protein
MANTIFSNKPAGKPGAARPAQAAKPAQPAKAAAVPPKPPEITRFGS